MDSSLAQGVSPNKSSMDGRLNINMTKYWKRDEY